MRRLLLSLALLVGALPASAQTPVVVGSNCGSGTNITSLSVPLNASVVIGDQLVYGWSNIGSSSSINTIQDNFGNSYALGFGTVLSNTLHNAGALTITFTGPSGSDLDACIIVIRGAVNPPTLRTNNGTLGANVTLTTPSITVATSYSLVIGVGSFPNTGQITSNDPRPVVTATNNLGITAGTATAGSSVNSSWKSNQAATATVGCLVYTPVIATRVMVNE